MNRNRWAHVRRRVSRGVTLVEILIVLAIIGLIAGGVAAVAVPKFNKAKLDAAKKDCQVLQPIADAFRSNNGECPTIQMLREKKELSASSNINDPWGSPYLIICQEDELTVASNGPDKKQGTADDIRVPDAPKQ